MQVNFELIPPLLLGKPANKVDPAQSSLQGSHMSGAEVNSTQGVSSVDAFGQNVSKAGNVKVACPVCHRELAASRWDPMPCSERCSLHSKSCTHMHSTS